MMKGKQLERRLRALGVAIIMKRGKGGHRLAVIGERQATIPSDGDIDFSPEFIKRLCKQLGLDPREVL